MRKLLPILLLAVLFISCSSDDDNDPNNGNQNGKDMIDEKIVGKWKVEYSKTIKGARLLDDGTLEIADNAVTTEYIGNFGEPNVIPNSGMFDTNEYKIEIKSDNTIISTRANNNPTRTIYYKIEDGLLKWVESLKSTSIQSQDHKYKLENGKLTIERIPTMRNSYTYTISEYSKITE